MKLKLSSGDLKMLNAFEEVVARFERQFDATRVPRIYESVRSSRDAYVDNPTDENLEKFRLVLAHEAHMVFSHTNGPQFGITIDLARKAFYEREVKPWIDPILSDALKRARDEFEAVLKTESAKIEAATGHPYHSGIKSKVIDEAAAQVKELEKLQSSIGAKNFLTQLRAAFAA